jgi:hypothetical protein
MKNNLLKRTNFQPIKKIKITVDHNKLLSCFENFNSKQDSINKKYGSEFINFSYEQMTITRPSNHLINDEHSYNELIDEFKNSYVEEVLAMFKSKPTRVRYIVKKPGAFILPHIDYDTTYSMRYYIPLQTNEWAFTAVKEKNKEPIVQNLKADGSVYFVNPGYLHSAWNFGNIDDIRLILSVNGQEDYYE